MRNLIYTGILGLSFMNLKLVESTSWSEVTTEYLQTNITK